MVVTQCSRGVDRKGGEQDDAATGLGARASHQLSGHNSAVTTDADRESGGALDSQTAATPRVHAMSLEG
jgi:hypothetical protein